jgi:hypothetical protein
MLHSLGLEVQSRHHGTRTVDEGNLYEDGQLDIAGADDSGSEDRIWDLYLERSCST